MQNIAEVLKKNGQTQILDALNKLSGAGYEKLKKRRSTGMDSPS